MVAMIVIMAASRNAILERSTSAGESEGRHENGKQLVLSMREPGGGNTALGRSHIAISIPACIQ